MTDDDYGHAERAAALALSEAELRRRVDVLLEQCGRETAHPVPGYGRPAGPYLHVSEVLLLLGLGKPVPYKLLAEAIAEGDLPLTPEEDAEKKALLPEASSGRVICGNPECPAAFVHYGPCPELDNSEHAQPSVPIDYQVRPLIRPVGPEVLRNLFRQVGHELDFCTDGMCGKCEICDMKRAESTYGIRHHLSSTPEKDAKQRAFEVLASNGYCIDGTCGECGACELRYGELPVNGCPFCNVSANPDLVDHVRNCHPLSFMTWNKGRS